jgi:hypothetical protein
VAHLPFANFKCVFENVSNILQEVKSHFSILSINVCLILYEIPKKCKNVGPFYTAPNKSYGKFRHPDRMSQLTALQDSFRLS